MDKRVSSSISGSINGSVTVSVYHSLPYIALVGYYARTAARRLLRAKYEMPCDGPLTSPCTWQRVASERGHDWEVYDDPCCGPGEFATCEPGTGCIRINAAHPPCVQVHAWVHELGHAEINAMEMRLRPSGPLAGRIEAGRLRHDIARAVEVIILGRALGTMLKGDTIISDTITIDSPRPFIFDIEQDELSPAQKELLAIHRQHLELWQSQTDLAREQNELARQQTLLFKELAERVLDKGDETE